MDAIGTRKRFKFQLLGLLGALLVFSVWGLSVYVKDILAADSASGWPTSYGHVARSAASNSCGNGQWYWPQVRYEYAVAGQIYTSDVLAFGNIGCGTRRRAELIAGRFPTDAPVLVHFNPEHPQNAVLMTGQVLDDTWTGVKVFAALLGGCALLTVWVLRSS